MSSEDDKVDWAHEVERKQESIDNNEASFEKSLIALSNVVEYLKSLSNKVDKEHSTAFGQHRIQNR